MRIAIITLPLHTNYGGLLQAYALQTVLERMGHQATVVDKKEFSLGLNIPLRRIVERLEKRLLRHDDCYVFYERKIKQWAPIIRQHTNRFIQSYIHTVKVRSLKNLKDGQFDAFVVGSDQIWRPVFTPQIDLAYLSFTKGWDVLRLSYAASFGVDTIEYTPSQIRKCKEAIAHFRAVSVRESSGVDLCRQLFGVEAEWMIDPTLLLSKNDYVALVEKAGISQSAGSLFCYVLDKSAEIQKVIDTIGSQRQLTPFFLNAFSENKKVEIKKRVQPPVEAWLRAFMDAEFVVTDSFHACVFSILFHKPFVVCANHGRGVSRLQSLLGAFGLADRFIFDAELPSAIFSPIDWEDVDRRLDGYRLNSQAFLSKYLGKN